VSVGISARVFLQRRLLSIYRDVSKRIFKLRIRVTDIYVIQSLKKVETTLKCIHLISKVDEEKYTKTKEKNMLS